jgi:hypothetical protein
MEASFWNHMFIRISSDKAYRRLLFITHVGFHGVCGSGSFGAMRLRAIPCAHIGQAQLPLVSVLEADKFLAYYLPETGKMPVEFSA